MKSPRGLRAAIAVVAIILVVVWIRRSSSHIDVLEEQLVVRGETRDRRQGHPVELLEIPGLGHQWAEAQQINSRIWQFLRSHRQESVL